MVAKTAVMAVTEMMMTRRVAQRPASSSVFFPVSVSLVVSPIASVPRSSASLIKKKWRVESQLTRPSSKRRSRARVFTRDKPRNPSSHLSRSKKRPEPSYSRHDKFYLKSNSFT